MILDLFKSEDVEFTLGEIADILQIEKTDKNPAYKNLAKTLLCYVENGLFTRRIVKKFIKAGRNGKGGFIRTVYSYKPKKWVLHSVCDGFYEDNLKKLENNIKNVVKK